MRSSRTAGGCRETEPVTGLSGARVPTGPRSVRLSRGTAVPLLSGKEPAGSFEDGAPEASVCHLCRRPLAVLLQPQLVVQGLGFQV